MRPGQPVVKDSFFDSLSTCGSLDCQQIEIVMGAVEVQQDKLACGRPKDLECTQSQLSAHACKLQPGELAIRPCVGYLMRLNSRKLGLEDLVWGLMH